MNKGIKKKLNCNYSNISGNHATVIKNDYSKKIPKIVKMMMNIITAL